ncbi:hypothetical protein CAOG_08381 [Capsaspora owczarzaki ATCC 30864]|uniref:Uncharacterized protein n=1 Tax=Capsaspora owczarzaki (strain ATCC 30864) TaxID=595528 RepID=A0A0D2WYD4_CAPO3|nr:hypothetical protein CAOG_08381 [Capsaspora owczarzaki ATCC 30864]KJE98450.1 hypothetical protein CAOG_008381 [Capsaspora owczarzaki ATCC 30864]|eukprot:XP_004340033.1 hypothetical protein CAOG_08381 [Capsaspora owczarzaki ATCC 30864]
MHQRPPSSRLDQLQRKPPPDLEGLEWVGPNSTTRYLGVMLGHGDLTVANFGDLLDKLHGQLSRWLVHGPSLPGRVLIANTIALSKVCSSGTQANGRELTRPTSQHQSNPWHADSDSSLFGVTSKPSSPKPPWHGVSRMLPHGSTLLSTSGVRQTTQHAHSTCSGW